jgi:hypothetical protein
MNVKATEPPKACLLGSLRSVDYWPLAKIFTRFLGVSCDQYPLVSLTGVTGLSILLLKSVYCSVEAVLLGPINFCGGSLFGELSGGNWMAFLTNRLLN